MLKVLVVLAFLLGLYFVIGQLMCRRLQLDCNLTLFPVVGYIVCMVLFQVIAIPLMIVNASVTLVSGIFLVTLLIFILLLGKVAYKKEKIVIKLDKAELLVISVVILLQCGLLFINMCYGSAWDNCQYVGEISTSLFTNTFKRYDPYTGKVLETFRWQDCFWFYEAHSAVICKIFSVHPLIYVHRILANIEIVLANAITYNILLVLLKGKRRTALVALIGTMIINLFAYSLYSWSGFMFIRTGEAKSMLAVVIIPLLIYCFLKMAEIQPNRGVWILLILSIIMGLGISKSGSFIIPLIICCQGIWVFFRNWKWSVLVSLCICMIPCAIYVLIQMV